MLLPNQMSASLKDLQEGLAVLEKQRDKIELRIIIASHVIAYGGVTFAACWGVTGAPLIPVIILALGFPAAGVLIFKILNRKIVDPLRGKIVIAQDNLNKSPPCMDCSAGSANPLSYRRET